MDPTACVFVDDIGKNLKVAKKLGMTTIRAHGVTEYKPDDSVLKQISEIFGFDVCPTEALDPTHRHAIETGQVDAFLRQEQILTSTEKIVSCRKFKQGQSNPTYVLTFGPENEQTNDVSMKPRRRVVLRKKPAGEVLPTAHRVDREYRLLKALGENNTGVPCPKMIAFCNDKSVVGSDCYFMEFVQGRNILDPNLSFFPQQDSNLMYESLIDTLVSLHSADYQKIGLGDFGKATESYFGRQLDRWSAQFTSEENSMERKIPEMHMLVDYLKDAVKTIPDQGIAPAITHGDYRIDNVLFHPFEPRVASILDVELATIGHCLSDVALLAVYHNVVRDGFLGPKPRGLKNPGIPSDVDLFESYIAKRRARGSHMPAIPNWNVLSSFCYFRIAAIFHGVYARSLKGNASSERAQAFGEAVPFLVKKGLEFANRPGLRVG